ncbi:MAG: redoxin family protein [Planctomycetes bacterium]|nr:redoxin family protein [Planctomycetota bacterium]
MNLLALPLLVFSLLQNAAEVSPKTPQPLGQMPNFTLPSARELRLISKSDFAGKVVLLEIWRTNCPRCQREADYIAQLRKKYNEKNFEVLCVADEDFDPKSEPVARVLDFAKEHHFDHPIALNDGGEFHSAYYQKMRGTPSAYLIHRNGETDFIGEDPARPEMRSDLEHYIEKCIAEPAPAAAPSPIVVKSIPDFTLISTRGGAIKSGDLRGNPAIVAILTPRLTPRYGPTLSTLATKYGALGLRVIGVTFGANRDIVNIMEQLRPGYELAIPDAHAQEALVNGDLLPKFLFITADGKILKSINTIYGREAGIESSVFDRYAALLVGKDVKLPELVDANAGYSKLGYHHPELGFGFDPPQNYRSATSEDGSKIRYIGATTQEFKVSLEQRYGVDAASAERIADVLGQGVEGRRIDSRAWQELNGFKAYIVRESWNSPLGSVRAVRVLMPAAMGIYVVTASAPDGDFSKDADILQKALFSFHPGPSGRN